MIRVPTKLTGLVAVGSVLMLAGCGSSDTVAPGDATVKDYFTAVQAVIAAPAAPGLSRGAAPGLKLSRGGLQASSAMPPVTATFHTGTAPFGTGGPTVTGGAESSALVGQPFRFGITADGQFTTIYIAVQGAAGYYELTVPAGTTAADLVLTLNSKSKLPQLNFALQVAAGSGGNAGAVSTTQIATADLADADISVILTWTGASDVDLQVTDPNGVTVYWDHTTTPEGGRLDLDSNPDCVLDNVNQETISWPKGRAPAGTYTVAVDLYKSCGTNSSSYTVTAKSKGQSTKTQSGALTGAGDQNASPTTIFTFTH